MKRLLIFALPLLLLTMFTVDAGAQNTQASFTVDYEGSSDVTDYTMLFTTERIHSVRPSDVSGVVLLYETGGRPQSYILTDTIEAVAAAVNDSCVVALEVTRVKPNGDTETWLIGTEYIVNITDRNVPSVPAGVNSIIIYEDLYRRNGKTNDLWVSDSLSAILTQGNLPCR